MFFTCHLYVVSCSILALMPAMGLELIKTKKNLLPVCDNGVRCTIIINRSHSTPCKKAEFEHLQIFPGHCLDFFLSVSGKICHSPIKKVKRQPTLIISFSEFSVLWGTVKKSGLKSDPCHTLPGECAGESVTK